MKRQQATFTNLSFSIIKEQLLHWANQYNNCSFLDNHFYPSQLHTYECMVAVGVCNSFTVENASSATQLSQLAHFFNQQSHDWLFGHIGYDFKNALFPTLLPSKKKHLQFADLFFYQPQIVVQLFSNYLVIASINITPSEVFAQICNTQISVAETPKVRMAMHGRLSKAAYIEQIQQLQQHILRGDCYEINFCQEFYNEQAVIHPVDVYKQLTQISPNPFSCFYKQAHNYLLCASPERYIKKQGSVLISQPIKGTFKRHLTNPIADEQMRSQLLNSEKDKSENVMVVDLVRNDLSRICERGSVKVDELFGVYTFPQVHQMISTVSGIVNDSINFADVLGATFPMGSMTGAPKCKVMELIDAYEPTARGLYSGAVGYISPDGNFDFNVVIRSLLYNQQTQYLSYQVGGGITYYSHAESEYEECLLKAAAIQAVLL